jgi:RNA recognition motif-containing protein
LDPDATIVFQNLTEDVTEDQLLAMLSAFGIPFSVKLVKEDKTPGIVKAFVQYDKKDTAKAVIDKFNNTERAGKQLIVELANKKNKVFIKAKYHDGAVEELKKTLEGWRFEENDTHEVSLDKAFFIIQLKFENEDTANKFLDDFRANPTKCIIIRPYDFECRRQNRTKDD